MKYTVTFSDGSVVIWVGQSLTVVNQMVSSLANGRTYTMVVS